MKTFREFVEGVGYCWRINSKGEYCGQKKKDIYSMCPKCSKFGFSDEQAKNLNIDQTQVPPLKDKYPEITSEPTYHLNQNIT